MKSVLILLFVLIVGVATYSVLTQEEKQAVEHTIKNKKVLEPKQEVPRIQKQSAKTKQTNNTNQAEGAPTVEDEDILPIAENTSDIADNAEQLGKELEHISYEEIENNNALSDEEKEIMKIDKAVFEADTAEPTVPMTEEEVSKLMEEDMQNELSTNETN